MKQIKYQLIISDFDGTLASSDGTVSEKNKKAIFEYISSGGIFAVSTGRLPPAILPQARKLGLKGLISCGQGTVILDIESGDVLFEKRLSLDTTLSVCKMMEDMGLHILAFDLWNYYSNKDNDMLSYYESVAGVKGVVITDRKISSFLEEKQMQAYKLVALVDPKDNAEFLQRLKNENLIGCDITKSMDFLVEVVNPTLSKGTALAFLAEKYGIPIEKTVGIGDNFNDVSMIECAGLGAAVANAEGSLKECADYICEHTNDESAIAEIIEKFGFSKL